MDKVSIYEYISFIMPGGAILAMILFGFEVAPTKVNPSATLLIILTAVAFLIGHLNVAIANFLQPLAWGKRPGSWPSSTAGLFGRFGRYNEADKEYIEKVFERLFPEMSNFQKRFNLGYSILRQEQLDGHLQVLNQQIGFYRNMTSAVIISIGTAIAAHITGHQRISLALWCPLLLIAASLFLMRYRRFWVRFGDEVIRGIQAWEMRRRKIEE
ncbi:hypothetical protein [Actinomadura nitritigenes]|uniref:hypothetical protein n=1 Tax=Actinomadura nitritigenes TaxID=134602 RepID=UPI003D93B846